MSLPSLDLTNSLPFQGLGLKESAYAAASAPRREALDRAGLAETKAKGLAEAAQQLHIQINRSIALYNAQSEPAIHAQVEDYRARFGEGLAQSTEESLRLLKSDARQSLEDSRAALAEGFAVTGTPYAYDPATDRYAPQAFCAEAALPGARIRYDSTAGAALSLGGGSFKAIPLPAAGTPQGLLDLDV